MGKGWSWDTFWYIVVGIFTGQYEHKIRCKLGFHTWTRYKEDSEFLRCGHCKREIIRINKVKR